MKPMRLMGAMFTVGGWTLISRVLGFAREILLARTLGTGPVAEAFLVAFSLPNMFRRFFAEGALNAAFVPLFSRRLDDREAAHRFASDAFSMMASFLLLFSLICTALMPLLVLAMASGFVGDARFTLSVDYGRVTFVYILFISLAALLSGMLNALGRFAMAAAAPSLLNLLFIVSLIGAAQFGASQEQVGRVLAWTVPVAGVAQLALVWWAAARVGFAPRLHWPVITPELKRLLIIAAPAVLAGGVVQVNLLVGRQVASLWADGAIAWLTYADRLYQLPLGVVGIAIGVVLLPALSRRLAEGDMQGGRDAFNRAFEMALILTLPAAAALIVIAGPLVMVLYEGGAFDAEDTSATALALMIYGAGLPAFVAQKLLQPLYYAREDTRTPFRLAVWSMVVNAAIAFGLAPLIGWSAAALGTTVSSWAMVLLLWWQARGMGEAVRFDARLMQRLPRIIAATVLMSVLIGLLAWVLEAWLAAPGLNVLALLILVVAGIIGYFAALDRLGGASLAEIRSAVRRGGEG